MHKLFLLSCLAIASQLSAPLDARSVFSYTPDQGLAGQVRCTQDVVGLKNGTQLCGQLKKIPPLLYPFGIVSLDIDQVSLISNVPNSWGKWEVVTTDGKRYVASLGENRFIFQNAEYTPSQVDYIMVKPRGYTPTRGTFQLSFVSGDEIPVEIIDKVIPLSYGNGSRALSIGEIVSVSYKGGLFGHIKNQQGKVEDLEFGFVKSPFLTVLLHGSREGRKLRWNTVYEIKKNPEISRPSTSKVITKSESKPLFEKQPQPILTFSEADEKELIALGVDFTFDDLTEEPEAENEEEEFDFTTQKKDVQKVESKEFLALGEDFNLDDLEAESPESQDAPTEPEDEYNFTNIDEEEAEIVAMVDFQDQPLRSVASTQQGVYDGMVYIDSVDEMTPSFYLKTDYVTNREYQQFVKTVNYRPPSHWIRGEIPPGQEDKPIVNVSYKDALLFTVWSGKRLPTLEELEIASKEGQLTDMDFHVYEWTATPPLNGPDSSRSHVLFGKDTRKAMHNNSSDSYTGFRVAADAH